MTEHFSLCRSVKDVLSLRASDIQLLRLMRSAAYVSAAAERPRIGRTSTVLYHSGLQACVPRAVPASGGGPSKNRAQDGRYARYDRLRIEL